MLVTLIKTEKSLKGGKRKIIVNSYTIILKNKRNNVKIQYKVRMIILEWWYFKVIFSCMFLCILWYFFTVQSFYHIYLNMYFKMNSWDWYDNNINKLLWICWYICKIHHQIAHINFNNLHLGLFSIFWRLGSYHKNFVSREFSCLSTYFLMFLLCLHSSQDQSHVYWFVPKKKVWDYLFQKYNIFKEYHTYILS